MGKVVLITGGAKGIGKAIALELAKNRYDIVINYLTSHQEANCLKEYIIQQYHVRCLALKADVSKEDQVEKMIEEIDNQLGGVDILINNAGIDLSNLFHLKTADEFRKTLDVNVVGAYNCSKSVSAHMLKQDYGRIINISSTNGMNTYYPMCIDYDASKAALISLTHNLAFEFGPYIHVNCIAPGFIGTENELDGYDEEFLKEEQEKLEEVARNIDIKLLKDKVYLNGRDVTEKIRSNEVSNIVSPISNYIGVRESMLHLQRSYAKNNDIVMEGRDITTVVFPNATYKFYLDATLEERANRRYKQNKLNNISCTYEEVLENIEKRDYNDLHKKVGALKRSDDQVYIDTTNKTIEEVVDIILNVVRGEKQ